MPGLDQISFASVTKLHVQRKQQRGISQNSRTPKGVSIRVAVDWMSKDSNLKAVKF